MSKRRPSPRRLAPDDVLAGRVRPSIGDLMDLIHHVNPTGQGLAPRHAEIRYSVKSRLQSLLIRTFADEIDVVPDPAREGTVSLVHRGHRRDACHAVIAELEDDARAWVQLQIDLGGSADEEASSPARPGARRRVEEALDDAPEDEAPEALVRRAERAIEAYDYELGRACLERATAKSQGAAGPAAALLALLVETLGDDAAALDVGASLGREAMADPAVRGPLAIAAARLGQEDRAVALARGLAPDRAAGVFAALASAALGVGDVDRAASHLDRATRSDPAHTARAALEAEIARARASHRGPAEEEIGRLLEAGHDEEAARRAGEVLIRWPESGAARRALRSVEERRQRAEAQRLTDDADAALAGGEATTALGLLERAIVLLRGADRASVERQIAEIEAELRAKREAELASAVLGKLDEPDPREGLAAYLDLDEALRRRVREARPRDDLRWIDLVADSRGSVRAKVEAVTALARARRIAAEDPGAAMGLVEAHPVLLDRVPEARRMIDAARACLARERTARARAGLRAAQAARDPAEVLARLDETTVRDLPEDERALAAALRASAAAAVEREGRVAQLRKLCAAGQWFEARALAEDLAESTKGDERTRWERQRQDIQAEIQRWFRVEVDDDPASLDDVPPLPGRVDFDDALCVLQDDGRHLVLAESHGCWALVRSVDVETTAVRRSMLLRTPQPLGRFRVEVRGPRVWLVGQAALEIALGTGEVMTWRGTQDLVPAGETVLEVMLAAGSDPAAPRYLWVGYGEEGGRARVRVIDVDRRKVSRDLPEATEIEPLRGPHEPRAATATMPSLTLHEARGAPLPLGRLTLPGLVQSVAPRPDGLGWVALVTTPARALVWAEIGLDGIVGPTRTLDDEHPFCAGALAVSREAGLMFAQLETTTDVQLAAYEASGGRLTPRYRVPLAHGSRIAQDGEGRRAAVIHVHGGGLDVTVLGADPPTQPVRPPSHTMRLPTPTSATKCMVVPGVGKVGEERRALVDQLRSLPAAARSRWLRTFRETTPDPAETIFEMILMLREMDAGARADAHALVAWLYEAHPKHAATLLIRADEALRAADWPTVRAFLAKLDEDKVGKDEGRKRHFYHMRALAALHLGEARHAADLVEEARSHEGPCDLDGLAELSALLLDPPSEAPEEGSGLAQAVGGSRAADARLAAGDPRGAITALEATRRFEEVQMLARQAEAYLQLDAGSRHERLRKVLTLARFVAAHERSQQRQTLPLGDATWADERLEALAARARAWLEEAG